MKRILLLLLPMVCVAAAASAQDGAALYRRDCAACHDVGVDRAPSRDALQSMTADRVLAAMETGPMISMASRNTGAERRAIAQFVTGKTLSGRDLSTAPAQSAMCVTAQIVPGAFNPAAGKNWNGWGDNTSNTRFQDGNTAGLTGAQAGRLKVKWAFGFPGDLDANAQPTVVGGRVFVGSAGGTVYSLSADSGCVYWFFKATGSVRGAVSIGKIGDVYGAFFGDLSGNLYALNAVTGAQLWTVRADESRLARLMGSVVFHNGRLYVGVASGEETVGATSNYECCKFRGSVSAYDAATGKQIWKTYTITEEPKPTTKNAVGTQMYGPSGAGVWSSPAIDPLKNILYATTGDNYSAPASNMSDSFLALDRDTGRILWARQMTTGDAWNTACRMADKTNCPDQKAPDFDFSSPPMLVALANGKRALVAGQKSGVVHAIDPDDNGKILWQQRVGVGGTLGGVQWGSSTDGANVYVALSDIVRQFIPNSLGSNADPKAGGGLFAFNLQTGQRVWYTPPAPCGTRPRCSPAQSAAISSIPGVVFSGSVDGHLRGYSTADGKVIFDYDAMQTFKTVNEVPARGGSFDGPGPAIAGGMMFVSSGYARAGGIPGNVLLAFSVDGK
ncbi:MAG TPA: PQQ-binding-like beta-propeller repeat protein [Vicinamibacterales bacterium]|nr:PQQ-binding-like beta-propeller repeat protein [Vicinamibacterales bacterium]